MIWDSALKHVRKAAVGEGTIFGAQSKLRLGSVRLAMPSGEIAGAARLEKIC